MPYQEKILLEKKAMRAEYINHRASLPTETQESHSIRIMTRLLQIVAIPEDAVVAGYYPIKGECDPLPLLDALDRKGHTTALPIIIEKDHPLAFRKWQPDDPLVEGPFYAIHEPAEVSPLVEPDFILVPLVAFDRKGYRIGYGKGFYDRTIINHKKGVKTVGLAYSCQEAPNIPHDKHDQPLDYIVTENEVIECFT